MIVHPRAAACWICLEEGPDKKGKPLVRDCACRGDDAGFAHASCTVKYARRKCEEAILLDSNGFVAPWEKCPNCHQNYQNELSIHLSTAFFSYVKSKYDHPGNDLVDRISVMDALRLKIQTNRVAMERKVKGATSRRKIEALIHNLLERVWETKAEFDMEEWVHMEPTSSQFQFYKQFTSNYEAYGYFCLGQFQISDQSGESTYMEIMYYKMARDLYQSVGSTAQTKLVNDSIDRARAKLEGDVNGQLEKTKNIYENRIQVFGETSEQSISMGVSYVTSLRRALHSIEAERLATKLAAICRQVYGENHECTKESVQLLKECKLRLVRVESPAEPTDGKLFRALRYENDGEIICVQDKDDEEGQTFHTACELIHPEIGCPVICQGLKSASHLNGKLGDVRSCAKDSTGDLRFAVHFEDQNLKPAGVKRVNLCIAFDLPNV